MGTLAQQQQQSLDGNHEVQEEQDQVNGAVVSAQSQAGDRFRGEAGRSARETAVVAPSNDSVGDSSTLCSDDDDVDDDDEEEETNIENNGGWVTNPSVSSTIVQKHQRFDNTNGYVGLPNSESSNFGDISVANSTEVRVGNEINYNAPVTINVVIANPTPNPKDGSRLNVSRASDNISDFFEISESEVNGAPNGSIFSPNTKLNKVTQWLWRWKRAILSRVLALILLAIVVSVTVYYTHLFLEMTNSSLEGTEAIVSHDSSGEFKVICYFTNWAWYRLGGKFVPEDIDPDLCTHVLHGFSMLDSSNLTMMSPDSWSDIDNKSYEMVAAFKAKGLKVLMALGGWNDSAGDQYSKLVNSPSARQRFIKQVLVFIETYGFDGLNLDWEYPVGWQADWNKGPESDKQSFAELVKELSYQFKLRGLLLSAAVSRIKKVIDAGYDVPVMSKYLDWISVMTYDFHGQWDEWTSHVAPLYSLPNDWEPTLNANFSIHYWIEKGANPKKLIMGVPLYGQSFLLANKNIHGLNSPIDGGSEAGRGFLSYYEICERTLKKGWTVVQEKERRIGPYAYKGHQWVSFDDAQQIKLKAELIKKLGLGGGMVWALELDDFKNRCGCEPSPLLRTMNRVLRNYPKGPLCPVTEDTEAIVSHDSSGEFKVICYFTHSAWYRLGGKFVPEDIDPDLCTHVIYGFSLLDSSSLPMKPPEFWSDIDKTFYERVAAFKAKGLKVLMAVGGWKDPAGDQYSRLVDSPSARIRFIKQILVFIKMYGFDGLNLDWEYPVGWPADRNKGPESDKQSFAELVKELSYQFKLRGLLLSAAVSRIKRVIDAGYDVPVLSKYLDWISVMTYNFHGQWDKKTSHVAPLYSLPSDGEPTLNANFSIHYWIEKGANPKKLIMGTPLYGQSFLLAASFVHVLNSPIYGGGEAGEATKERGFLSYYEICERTLKKGWKVVQDKERRIGPYAYKGDQWVGFDDAQQIKLKAELIKKLGLGGGMVWALDLDDFKNRCGCEPSPLLRTMNRVLRNYPKGPLCLVTEDRSVQKRL